FASSSSASRFAASALAFASVRYFADSSRSFLTYASSNVLPSWGSFVSVPVSAPLSCCSVVTGEPSWGFWLTSRQGWGSQWVRRYSRTRARSASLTERADGTYGSTGRGFPLQAGTAAHRQWSCEANRAVRSV